MFLPPPGDATCPVAQTTLSVDGLKGACEQSPWYTYIGEAETQQQTKKKGQSFDKNKSFLNAIDVMPLLPPIITQCEMLVHICTVTQKQNV